MLLSTSYFEANHQLISCLYLQTLFCSDAPSVQPTVSQAPSVSSAPSMTPTISPSDVPSKLPRWVDSCEQPHYKAFSHRVFSLYCFVHETVTLLPNFLHPRPRTFPQNRHPVCHNVDNVDASSFPATLTFVFTLMHNFAPSHFSACVFVTDAPSGVPSKMPRYVFVKRYSIVLYILDWLFSHFSLCPQPTATCPQNCHQPSQVRCPQSCHRTSQVRSHPSPQLPPHPMYVPYFICCRNYTMVCPISE